MRDLSGDYHNLQYAIETLCDVIEGCSFNKIIEERYLPQLDVLVERMKRLKKEMADSKGDIKRQNNRWNKKINSLIADARLDEEISEEMRERLVASLEDLAERVLRHEDL